MPQVLTQLLLFFSILWLIGLSFFVWRLSNHYNTLLKGSDKRTLSAILEGIIRETNSNKNNLAELAKQYDRIDKESKYHIQKIGLLRFNPFKDTGGDQSFILTLVDANDTGVIISGLYSRSGTRWYAKKIVKGKGHEHDLSEDERKALKLAQPISLQ